MFSDAGPDDEEDVTRGWFGGNQDTTRWPGGRHHVLAAAAAPEDTSACGGVFRRCGAVHWVAAVAAGALLALAIYCVAAERPGQVRSSSSKSSAHRPHAGVVLLDAGKEDGGDGDCEDPHEGDECWEEVTWAMQTGIFDHPSWYEGLEPNAGFIEFQNFLADKGLGHCLRSCRALPGDLPGPTTTAVSKVHVHSQLLATTTVTMKNFNKAEDCGNPQPGEQCWVFVNYAMTKGIKQSPKSYPGLKKNSSFHEFQQFIHESGKGSCPRPCLDDDFTTEKQTSEDKKQKDNDKAHPPGEDNCHDPDPGEQCYIYVTWAMKQGIFEHPEWYDGLTSDSSWDDFQLVLHANGHGNCEKPCRATTTTAKPATTTTKTAKNTTEDGNPAEDLDTTTTEVNPKSATSTTKVAKTTTTVATTTKKCVPDHPEGSPSLFCYSVMQAEGAERDLVQSQFDRGASIFSCNEFAVICPQKISFGLDSCGNDVWTWVNDLPSVPMGDLGQEGVTTSSFLNTQTFLLAWDTLMNSGHIWSHDWIAKVDPDAVFYPSRLRQHVMDYTGRNVFILNCNWGGESKIFGAIEVFSIPAMRLYEQGVLTCKELPWQGWGEDMYMQECMATLGAEGIDDFTLVGDARCADAACDDPDRVAFHPFKDTGSYWECADQRSDR